LEKRNDDISEISFWEKIMGITREYLTIQQQFERRYGENTVILMQVGSFYEVYEYDPNLDGENIIGNESCGNIALKIAQTPQRVDQELNLDKLSLSETDFTLPIGNAVNIALILNMRLTSKNKGNPHSIDNPYLVGFPCIAYENHRDIILMHGYTIVRIDQNKTGNTITREIVEISSPGTEIDNSVVLQTNGSNSIVSIYIECQKGGTSPRLCENNMIICGMSWLDISTGQTLVCETYSKEKDEVYAIHEIYRFIHTHQPAELLINVGQLEISQAENYRNYLQKVLELDKIPVKIVKINDLDSNYFKIEYQEEFFRKAYSREVQMNEGLQFVIIQPGSTSPIDDLDLELYTYGRISFLLLLQYCYEHNEFLIKCLRKPQVQWSDQTSHLVLTHNAVTQLELLPKHVGPIMRRRKRSDPFDSLISVLDCTSTQLGSRFLRKQLLNPITDIDQLEMYYVMTRDLMDNEDLLKTIEIDLRKIPDIERLQRKMQTSLIRPKEFSNLFNGYIQICGIYSHLSKHCYDGNSSLSNLFINSEHIKDFNECLTEILSMVDLDILSTVKSLGKNNQFQSDSSFIRRGYDLEIDKLFDLITQYREWLRSVCDHLNSFLADTRGKLIEPKFERSSDENSIHITLHTTTAKANRLKSNINSVNTELCGTLEFLTAKSGTIISSEQIRRGCYELSSVQMAMERLLLKKYNEIVERVNQRKFFDSLNKFVATIDFLKTNARTAQKYKYYQPQIDRTASHSYLKIKDLRHPLIERISRNEYIANDILLGESPLGLLLFGVNSTGKSSLAKAVTLTVIMAQAGMFTAGQMTYYPYSKIISRLSGHDDILKGQSSFVVEVTELRTILRSSDDSTLVIGDELCRGTETNSGTALTVATIETLIERKSCFVFSTHMHTLPSMSSIKNFVNEKKLRIAHLTASYDPNLKELVYDRKLLDGSGSSLYGLEVCRSLSLGDEFLTRANEIRMGLEGKFPKLLNTNKSRYNAKIYVDRCSLCNGSINLQTHHIQEQAKADKNGHIGYYHKDSLFNLLIICSDCHRKIHANGNNVTPSQTLNGVYLTIAK